MVILHERIGDASDLCKRALIVALEEKPPTVAVNLRLEHEHLGDLGSNDVHTVPR